MKRDRNDEPGKIEELEKKIEEVNAKYLRALADYQNLEKQTQGWKEGFVAYANSDLIGKLLEVLDDLEKAQENINDDGLGLVKVKLTGILKNEGLEEIEVLGKDYNPNDAEVVSTEPGDQEQKVLKVLQKGYKIKDRIIRPAKVVVSTKQTVDDGE